MGENTEVFGLKLRIQHLEERLSFVGGGTDTEQLLDLIQEKDEELKKKVGQVKMLDETMQKLVEGGKKLNERQKDLERAYTAKKTQVTLFESELGKQLETCEGLQKKVKEQEATLTQQETSIAELKAQEEASRDEITKLQGVIEKKESDVRDRDGSIKALRDQVARTESALSEMTALKETIKMEASANKDKLEKELVEESSRAAALEVKLCVADAESLGLAGKLDEAQTKLQHEIELVKALTLVKKESEAQLKTSATLADRLREALSISRKDGEKASQLETELRLQVAQLSKDLKEEVALHRASISQAQKKEEEQKKAYETIYDDLEKQMKEVEKTGTLMVGAIEREVKDLQGQSQEWSKEKVTLLRQVANLKAVVTELKGVVEDKERRIGLLEKTAKKGTERLQAEMNDMRADLIRHQGLRSEVARLQSEKNELVKRVKSQDAYLKRKLLEKKKSFNGQSRKQNCPAPALSASYLTLPFLSFHCAVDVSNDLAAPANPKPPQSNAVPQAMKLAWEGPSQTQQASHQSHKAVAGKENSARSSNRGKSRDSSSSVVRTGSPLCGSRGQSPLKASASAVRSGVHRGGSRSGAERVVVQRRRKPVGELLGNVQKPVPQRAR
ncbi:unnamed protein product [Chrysoparadoxa australica]